MKQRKILAMVRNTTNKEEAAAAAAAELLGAKLEAIALNQKDVDKILLKLKNQSPTNEVEYRLKLVLSRIANA